MVCFSLSLLSRVNSYYQAPYFDLGYDKVYQQAGDDIDWLNIQVHERLSVVNNERA